MTHRQSKRSFLKRLRGERGLMVEESIALALIAIVVIVAIPPFTRGIRRPLCHFVIMLKGNPAPVAILECEAKLDSGVF